ncbi:MAG: FecR domain-containing protein [Odoribacteraceae bacterium]|jgi:ferric-dicitrate binding protein FerR (iron transport regulator)|nr:FecR domain-containing protein [Odoribacteraceae bacterium]
MNENDMDKFAIAEIIAREVAGTMLPDEEKRRLDAWRARRPENESCYRECLDSSSREEYARIVARYDVAGEGERLRRRVAATRGRGLSRRLAIAAASVVALFALGYLAWERRAAAPVSEALQAEALAPGSSKAVLVMEDGRSVTLGGRDDALPASIGPAIVIDSNNTLTYAPVAGAGTSSGGVNILRTPPGGEYRLVLADGTAIYLNAGTEIRYPVEFSGEERAVELSGEAYFEVTPGARPFVLRASGAAIRVLGTSFNVKAYAGQSRLVATLEKGAVEVTRGEDRRVLSPGEQLIYNKEEGTIETRKVDARFYTSWKDGCYYFEETPLEEILGTLSAWYEIRVAYMDESARKIAFTGLLNRYSDMNELLRMFEETQEVTLSVHGKDIVVDKRKTGRGRPQTRD